MRELVLHNSPWRGRVEIPSSKSVAHRLLVCAALSKTPLDAIRILGTPSQDVNATKSCLATLMAEGAPVLDCGESGTTLRFMLPVAAALGKGATFIGHGRLPERPITPILDALAAHGVTATGNRLPLTIRGRLAGGEFTLPGDVSSQFISGMLLALPMTGRASSITLSTPLESQDYVRLTIAAMSAFGVRVSSTERGFRVEGASGYTALKDGMTVEGDWSSAAFPMAAAALGGDGLALANLDLESPQGDRRIVELLRTFGARVLQEDGLVKVFPGRLAAVPEIDVRAIPDMVPALAVVAGVAAGTTRFVNASRLRLKESDRLEATRAMITALGGHATVEDDMLTVDGVSAYRGGRVDGVNDHRIVMAAAAAAVAATGPVHITDAEACAKSWPDFWTTRSMATNEEVKTA